MGRGERGEGRGEAYISIDIEDRNRSQDRISVQASSSIIHIDIRHNEFPIPESLQETQHLRSLITSRASHSERLGELCPFGQSSVLVLHGEEAGALDFFPEVEASAVPVLADVGKVVGDDGPDYLASFLGLSVLDEVVTVCNEGLKCRSQ